MFKKLLIPVLMLLVLAPLLVMSDSTVYKKEFSLQRTDCSPYIFDGMACYDFDDDILYIGDGTTAQAQGSPGGSVTSSANITDHAIVRGDGGAKGIQESTATIDDSGNITVPGNLNLTGIDTNQLRLPMKNDATNPTICFDGGSAGVTCDSGILESSNDNLRLILGGSVKWVWSGAAFQSTSATGLSLNNGTASATTPVVKPNRADSDTGLGWAGEDQLSAIAGGVEGTRVTEASRTIESNATLCQTDGGDLQIITVQDPHGLVVDDVMQFADGTGSLCTGISANTNYYVTEIDSTTLVNIATSRGGSNITYTDAGTAFISYELEITVNIYGNLVTDVVNLKEITTPTAVANYGAYYTKSDNNAYFQDGAGNEHTLLKGASGVQHIFMMPFEDPTTAVGYWDVVGIGTSGEVHFIFQVPEDFEVLDAATIVMIPDATETIQWDINVSVAAVGEAYNNDDRTAADQQVGVTASQLTEIDISAQLTGLAAGDYVAIDFQSDTNTLRIIGMEFDFN